MFKKTIDGVLQGLTGTLNDLRTIAEDQVKLAGKADAEAHAAMVRREEADQAQLRANRIADKLAELLS